MTHPSSTRTVPVPGSVPSHLAIIMDGNGRWARQRGLPRFAGHQRGVESVRRMVRACSERGVRYLTLFAFSTENWRRPADEVALLMQLFIAALTSEVRKLHRNGVRLRVVGDTSRFDPKIQSLVESGERLTENNTGLTLTIAANYGGRWDILQAFARLCREHPDVAERDEITESRLAPYLSMAYAPEPDLFVRTGGESRVSNFLLWQLAYTELYFTDLLWPDFDEAALETAFAWYRARERRFGRTSEQLGEETRAAARPPARAAGG
ncbi:MAG: di-trans,poly-cis-decaprenylcistransferase [Betaproteobacteria bacterium RIFCSPLOWO2_02_FULL_66_14]|nr:MAG: di-trans,poly-cis-decaprenylcistransferase [Betaproteobacteria bacterium RIFCSPLOWO2_02_FULL_66_14]